MRTTPLPKHLVPVRCIRNNLFAEYPLNDVGRDFVVSDIHGHFNDLQRILDNLGFDKAVDRLFAVGDLVDRGPESILAFRWTAEPWFISVRGNHDQWCIDAGLSNERQPGHLEHGGFWFYDLPESARAVYAKVLLALPVAVEFRHPKVGKVGIVHAECPAPDWEEFKSLLTMGNIDTVTEAMWSRKRISDGEMMDVGSVDRIYAGHTLVDEVIDYGNTRFIDTGSGYRDGFMTVLEVGADG